MTHHEKGTICRRAAFHPARHDNLPLFVLLHVEPKRLTVKCKLQSPFSGATDDLRANPGEKEDLRPQRTVNRIGTRYIRKEVKALKIRQHLVYLVILGLKLQYSLEQNLECTFES